VAPPIIIIYTDFIISYLFLLKKSTFIFKFNGFQTFVLRPFMLTWIMGIYMYTHIVLPPFMLTG